MFTIPCRYFQQGRMLSSTHLYLEFHNIGEQRFLLLGMMISGTMNLETAAEYAMQPHITARRRINDLARNYGLNNKTTCID
jgi:hypothetical protein